VANDIWGDESISSTLDAIGLSAGADAELPDEVRFVRGVREILEAAAARHGSLSTPAVYVFAPSSAGELPSQAGFHPRIHTGEIDPAGRLWFVGAAARSGHCVDLEGHSAHEIFKFCEDLGFGATPAVFCDTGAAPALFAWYPSGLSQPDDVIEGPLDRGDDAPTLDELIEVVERVHRTRLMTSYNQTMDTTLWEKASHHWVHERAEKRVQDALMAGIGGAFGRPYFVEQERPGDTGRFDIGFRESADGGTSTLHAILELKVARSRGSGGASESRAKVKAHIVDGIEQSYAYAKEHGARDAACLVFDLRKEDKQIPPEAAVSRATQLNVFLEFWRCFPTAADYRTFKLPPPPD
jgi:hypothetical protein